jgi:hypothetical protein
MSMNDYDAELYPAIQDLKEQARDCCARCLAGRHDLAPIAMLVCGQVGTPEPLGNHRPPRGINDTQR